MRGSSSTSGITCWARCSSTGCPALKHSRIWQSLRATGAVRPLRSVAKTVTDELAFGLPGEPLSRVAAQPQSPGPGPGGSSSGSASAVACGLADSPPGTDT
ncbi:MAG: hypothetical protein HY574_07240 [candidate division NC10 bacterium]|nr:hypothetical protein [candidate division NC10 bacterium]